MSRTTEHLERKGVPFEASVHQQTYTTIDEARAPGIDADEVVKTLLLDTRSGHPVAVIPGDRRLDMRLVERAVGDRRAHLATEEEIQRDLPDYELGCLPPLGSLLGMPTYVDPGVTRRRTLGAGHGRGRGRLEPPGREGAALPRGDMAGDRGRDAGGRGVHALRVLPGGGGRRKPSASTTTRSSPRRRLRKGSVFAVDATSFFSRPGPRIVDGLEILAWAIHPEAFPEPPEATIARVVG